MAGSELAPFTGAQKSTVLAESSSAREAQEVQAAMVIAKRFPRDIIQAEGRILQSCRRPGLAEAAMYAYPKGGAKVDGPTIRLAEVLAQCWGNIDFGIKELEQRHGESTVLAYAWDLETNERRTITWTVRHERKVNQKDDRGKVIGSRIDVLDDPREIYEMVANQGARRLRACILAIIPGDIQDAAIEQCRKTLTGGTAELLIDRIKKMAGAFVELGISGAMLEGRLGHKLDATDANELVTLRNIYQSIRDGMSDRKDWFDLTEDGTPSEPKDEAPRSPDDLQSQPRKRGRPKREAGATTPEPTPPSPDDGELPPPPPEPTAEETRREASELFGGEPKPSDEATVDDLNRVKIIADLKVDEAGADKSEFNRKKVIGFACIGMFKDGVVPTKVSHDQAVKIAAAVKLLSKADVEEALA
jgi:hypothetical protein